MVEDNYEFKRIISSDIFEIRNVINEALYSIKINIPLLTADTIYEFKLILSELLYNAAIHGNKLDPKKNIHLSIRIHNNVVYTVISDEGNGFDYENLLNQLDNEQELFSESGRGIKLVVNLTDSLKFNHKGNIIKFRKRV